MSWRETLSLSTQFVITAALVLCISMAVLGTWVTHRITRSVLATSGEGGAHFMISFLQEEVQDLLPDGSMPAENSRRLDAFFVGTPVSRNIVSVKIWRPDGVVIYTNMAKDIIGQHFVSSDVAKAATGQIVSEFEDMVSAESAYEQSLDKSLIEVYAPLYKDGTDTVVAVGEIYEDADELAEQLRSSQFMTWVVVALTTLLMLALLYVIVRRGSHTISVQRRELRARIGEAQDMAAQNQQLRFAANEANEELLGRIGSDIHDGPIQLLTLVRFRLDEIAGLLSQNRKKKAELSSDLEEARTTLSGSIDELRHLSTGLVLLELDELTPREVIELACSRHESMTGTHVSRDFRQLPDFLSQAMKICVYRILQEALTNAFRHAGGIGQRVEARGGEGSLDLIISDQGGQLAQSRGNRSPHAKLGHKGIRNRVQAVGGTLNIDRTDAGLEVHASLPLG